MAERVKFEFRPHDDGRAVEDDIALAIFAAECIHGRPQTRLDVRYLAVAGGHSCVLEVSGPAGESAVRVLVGLFAARFGEAGFQVSRSTGALA